MSDFDDDIATPLAADFTEAKERELPNSQHVIFDLESGPAWHPGDSIDAAKAYCQPLGVDFDSDKWFEENPKPEPFDEDAVAFRLSKKGGGRLVNEDKIAEAVELAKSKHPTESEWEASAICAEQTFWEAIIDNAALSPVTGRVLAIGTVYRGEIEIPIVDEPNNLRQFWRLFEATRGVSGKLIGWNIANFDVPFLVWRSAALGVEIPRGVYRGKWLSDSFVDLMNYWPSMYSPWKGKSAWLGAKDAARFLGCSRPADEIEGKDFWRYFLGSEEERAKAIRYLENDVTEETIIAKALGVI